MLCSVSAVLESFVVFVCCCVYWRGPFWFHFVFVFCFLFLVWVRFGAVVPFATHLLLCGCCVCGCCVYCATFSQPEAVNQPVLRESQIHAAVCKDHESFVAVMSRRSSALRVLVTTWTSGNIRASLAHLDRCGDVSVAADFLSSVNLLHPAIKLQSCACLLPHVNKLLATKFEECVRVPLLWCRSGCSRMCHLAPHNRRWRWRWRLRCSYCMVGLKALRVLFLSFSPVVANLLEQQARMRGAIDVSHEDRARRVQACHSEFRSAHTRVNMLTRRPGVLGQTAADMLMLLEGYFGSAHD